MECCDSDWNVRNFEFTNWLKMKLVCYINYGDIIPKYVALDFFDVDIIPFFTLAGGLVKQ